LKDVRAIIQNANVQVFIDNARAICEFNIAARLGEIEITDTTFAGDQDGGGALPLTIDFHKTYFELQAYQDSWRRPSSDGRSAGEICSGRERAA
jgi:hypothetical protein